MYLYPVPCTCTLVDFYDNPDEVKILTRTTGFINKKGFESTFVYALLQDRDRSTGVRQQRGVLWCQKKINKSDKVIVLIVVLIKSKIHSNYQQWYNMIFAILEFKYRSPNWRNTYVFNFYEYSSICSKNLLPKTCPAQATAGVWSVMWLISVTELSWGCYGSTWKLWNIR